MYRSQIIYISEEFPEECKLWLIYSSTNTLTDFTEHLFYNTFDTMMRCNSKHVPIKLSWDDSCIRQFQ